MAKVNDVYIGDDDLVILSRQKILMHYSTLRQFREAFGISAGNLANSLKEPGVRWSTLNRNSRISKSYIDWDRTKFHIVDAPTKEAFKRVDRYGKGETWIT